MNIDLTYNNSDANLSFYSNFNRSVVDARDENPEETEEPETNFELKVIKLEAENLALQRNLDLL